MTYIYVVQQLRVNTVLLKLNGMLHNNPRAITQYAASQFIQRTFLVKLFLRLAWSSESRHAIHPVLKATRTRWACGSRRTVTGAKATSLIEQDVGRCCHQARVCHGIHTCVIKTVPLCVIWVTAVGCEHTWQVPISKYQHAISFWNKMQLKRQQRFIRILHHCKFSQYWFLFYRQICKSNINIPITS